jgi:glucose-6-phosphate 1-dehydrogenase
VALQLAVENWRWQGVPFYIRAGKCLPVTRTEVVVRLRRPPSIVEGEELPHNHFRFRLSPSFVIGLGAAIKKADLAPGTTRTSECVELEVTHGLVGELDPYDELLGDAMNGDSFRFAREDWVEEAWRIVDPAIQARTPVLEYEPGSWGPKEAQDMIPGGWYVSED